MGVKIVQKDSITGKAFDHTIAKLDDDHFWVASPSMYGTVAKYAKKDWKKFGFEAA